MSRVLAIALLALGVGVVLRTLLAGIGGGLGLLLGASLILAGAARLYLARGA